MSALAFLHVDGGPVARSPLATVAAAAGARLGVVDGWEVPVSFADTAAEQRAVREAVGLADSSAAGKLELQGSLKAQLDDPTPGRAIARDDAVWLPLSATRALALCEPTRTAAVRAGLKGSVVDVTAALASLTLAGPAARETFARFCALDLRDSTTPVGAVRPGSAARAPGIVWREAEDRWRLLFGAAYGEYVWTAVAHAAERLGGRPVGAGVLDA